MSRYCLILLFRILDFDLVLFKESETSESNNLFYLFTCVSFNKRNVQRQLQCY